MALFTSTAISLALLLAPPAPPRPRLDVDAPTGASADVDLEYRALVTRIEQLNDRMNQGEDVADELTRALADLSRHAPQLADDPTTQELRALAMLNLARARLAADMVDEAVEVLDEAIRTAMGEDLPADRFGPSLAKLYADRRRALEQAGKASIEIECQVPCRVFVNERAAGPHIDDLVLGTYRVWVEASSTPLADEAATRTNVNLTEPGQTASIELDKPKPSESRRTLDPVTTKRIMPMPAEAALITLGAGASLIGALLIGIGGDQRPQLITGSTMLGVGGAMLLAGSVTLGIDEVREANQRDRRLSLVWTMKF